VGIHKPVIGIEKRLFDPFRVVEKDATCRIRPTQL